LDMLAVNRHAALGVDTAAANSSDGSGPHVLHRRRVGLL
jgi:hypothetical protein